MAEARLVDDTSPSRKPLGPTDDEGPEEPLWSKLWTPGIALLICTVGIVVAFTPLWQDLIGHHSGKRAIYALVLGFLGQGGVTAILAIVGLYCVYDIVKTVRKKNNPAR